MGKSSVSEKCITCEAPLKYNSKEDIFKCEYCGNKFTLEELNAYKSKLTKNKEKKKETKKENKKIDVEVYNCENCGATIILGDNTASTSCVYCKSTAIIKDRLDGLYAPSRIITFKFTKEEAISKFKDLCKGRFLMPKDFDDVKNIQDMEGLYVPFWLYNCENDGKLSATCTKVTSWSDSKYINTKTDYYKVIRNATLEYNNVPNDAASRFDDKIMNAIEPFDYSEFKNFNMSYLSGYISEKYDVEKDDAYTNVKKRIDDDSKNYLLNEISGYTTKRVDSYTSSISMLDNDYVLLPVWVLNIKYKDKIYRFSMNGQTGKYVGEIPVDGKKLTLLIVITFVISMVVIGLIFFLIGGLS